MAEINQKVYEDTGDLQHWSNDFHTITADNGKEFVQHEEVPRILKTHFYFAHPNAAWERGSNENANGLVRQYIPKRRSFDEITQAEIERVMCLLNNRPRKCLDFLSPFEVFLQYSVALNS